MTNTKPTWEELKECSQCHERKEEKEYDYDRDKKIRLYCRVCSRKYDRARYYRNREKRLEKDKVISKKNYVRKAAQTAKYREESPEKHKARVMLKNYVYSGKLLKPNVCEDCGKEFEKKKIHGHHKDYSKPLEVNWLCARCHGVKHAKFIH